MRLRQFPDEKEFANLARTSNVIPVCREILADMETPVTIMRKIYRDAGPVFLLESMEGGERWGRYSFLGASSSCQVRVFRRHVEVDRNGSTEKIAHEGDPLGFLRKFMSAYRPAVMTELPRFWGGLVGYLTYEMVSFFEEIPNRLPDEEPLAQFMIPDDVLIFDNIANTLVLVAITCLDEHPDPAAAYRMAITRIEALAERIARPATDQERPAAKKGCRLTARQEPEAFRRQVEKVKDHIQAGDIIQAVISQPFSGTPAPDLLTLYRAQRYINPSPYLFFVHLGGTALIGSSPETMVRLENRVATLRPIAGTRPRGRTEQEDRALADELLKDEKERAEHLMLVDLGRNDLGRVAETGSVQVTDLMVVERYSHVMHLVSNICCDLQDGSDAWDLVRAAFPTGTLSGAPKVRAMEIIAAMEDKPRGPYGGGVGYVSFSGNLDMAITIRTACITGGNLTVRAGAGIVADSDPECERVETINKAMAIQKALELLDNN
ncbi:MAG: anthranilate synthase component I family protein [Desulfobacterales bacterium]